MSTALLQKVREYDIYYELLLLDKAKPLMQMLFCKRYGAADAKIVCRTSGACRRSATGPNPPPGFLRARGRLGRAAEKRLVPEQPVSHCHEETEEQDAQ
jgi:hypothetical protein